MPIMSKAEYAALKGVSRAYLSKKEMKDRLAAAMVTDKSGKQKIDSDIADTLFKLTQDPARLHLSKLKDDEFSEDENKEIRLDGFQKSRAQREALRVEEAQLDLIERKGRLLDRGSVIEACSASGQIIREHLKAAGRRIAEKAATMKDAHAIKSMIDEEHRAALEAASYDFNRRIPNISANGGQPTIN